MDANEIYQEFIWHVETTCPQHYQAAQEWANNTDFNQSMEAIMSQGEQWLEEHNCTETNETKWDDEEDWSQWEDDNDKPMEFNSTDDLYWALI
jgi:hypothetical protein